MSIAHEIRSAAAQLARVDGELIGMRGQAGHPAAVQLAEARQKIGLAMRDLTIAAAMEAPVIDHAPQAVAA